MQELGWSCLLPVSTFPAADRGDHLHVLLCCASPKVVFRDMVWFAQIACLSHTVMAGSSEVLYHIAQHGALFRPWPSRFMMGWRTP